MAFVWVGSVSDKLYGRSSGAFKHNGTTTKHNERIPKFGDQVVILKGLTINAGAEVEEQNEPLDQMEHGILSTGGGWGSISVQLEDNKV